MKSERMREGEERVPGVELANRRFPGLLTKQTESISMGIHMIQANALKN
ncbi:hypothetical protein DESA109040_04975 [Deinococcus saxicola]